MAYDRPRVFSDDPPLSSSVPEAPPLPLARSVLDRFRYSVRKPSTLSAPPDPPKDATVASTDFGIESSQSTSHRTGLKLRALDINQTRTHVVLAGGKILKTVRVGDEPSCTEAFNLRNAAVNYAWDSPSAHDVPSRGGSRAVVQDSASSQRDTFDIEDVAWSNNEFREYIATAARNGKIMLYDMSRPGVEVGSLHEHFRQVHKVDFNPLEGAYLLSGSQDGTVRLWDLRNYRKNAMVCTSMDTFPGRGEGVRHVKWSPRDTWSFAFGTDNGVIQRWDTRNNRSPVLKISAHYQTCNSIDWHPDGKHLVSAGKDQVVKVWNIAPDARGPAIFSLRTPREVQNVRWRPACFVTNSQDQLTKQCTQFATSYQHLSVVHVWDLRRPFVPFREIHHTLNSGTSDMLWRTKDLLWTVGPEGEFTQTDVAFAPKVVDRRPLSVISCAPDGELTFASKRRMSRHWGSLDIRSGPSGSGLDRGPAQASGRINFSRSPGDDSFDERFLGVTMKKRHSRAGSIKSNKSLGTTPPSTDEMARLIATDLKSAMDSYDAFRPEQSSKFGVLPGASPSGVFSYLAQNYLNPPSVSDFNVSYLRNVRLLFEQNAAFAQRASLYRDCQTWKLIGLRVSQQLEKRAETNRMARKHRSIKGKEAKQIATKSQTGTLRHSGVTHAENQRTWKAESTKTVQNASNAPTPTAKAVTVEEPGKLDANDDVEPDVELPPSVASNHFLRLASPQRGSAAETDDKGKNGSPGSTGARNNYNGLNVNDIEANRWTSKARVPYTLDVHPSKSESIDVRPPFERQDSSDSFMIFSTSSDSQSYRMQSNPFLTNSSPSPEQLKRAEQQRRGYKSGLPTTGSSRSRLSSGTASQDSRFQAPEENRESFLDLPTNGNLLLEDFVEHTAKETRWDGDDSYMSRSSTEDLSIVDFADDNGHDKGDVMLPMKPAMPLEDREVTESIPHRPPRERDRVLQHLSFSTSGAYAKLTEVTPAFPKVEGNDGLESESVILSDYLMAHEDEFSDGQSPVRPSQMLKKLLAWYSERGDAQMASQIFLLTTPLLSPLGSWSVSTRMQSNLSSSYYDHFTSAQLSMPSEVAHSIIHDFHAPLYRLDISPAFAESMLSTYHEQLLSSNLLNPAADLRRLAHPSFPAVFEQGLKDVEIGTLCLGCRNPINNPTNKMRCESCHERQADCAICHCRESPFEIPSAKKTTTATIESATNSASMQPNSTATNGSNPSPAHASSSNDDVTTVSKTISATPKLHTTCLICNHTTHTACSVAWFSDSASTCTGSGGACPVVGCLCDCVRGHYRTQRLLKQEATERQKRNAGSRGGGGGGVRRDDWSVGESRAVGRVRGALRGGDASEEGPTTPGSERGGHHQHQRARRSTRGGIGGVLAAHGRAMSDEGKKVRLLAPDSE